MESSAAQMVATTAAAGENDRGFDWVFVGPWARAACGRVPLCMTARPCPFISSKSRGGATRSLLGLRLFPEKICSGLVVEPLLGTGIRWPLG